VAFLGVGALFLMGDSAFPGLNDDKRSIDRRDENIRGLVIMPTYFQVFSDYI
jgi:hypothetical protein